MVNLNYQNDTKWKTKEMCPLPFLNGNKQDTPDLIGNIGCALTTRANHIQLATNRKLSPEELNYDIRENNGYWGMSQGAECPINKESYMNDSYFSRKWGLSFQYKLPAVSFSNHAKTLWEVRFLHYGYRHSSNILNVLLIQDRPHFVIYNVYNNQIQTLPFSEVIHINKITF